MQKNWPKYQVLKKLSLPKESAIICQYTGCSRPVYREVVVVLDSISLETYCLGSECYKKLVDKERVPSLSKSNSSVGDSKRKAPRSPTSVDYIKNLESLLSSLRTSDLKGLIAIDVDHRLDALVRRLRYYGVSDDKINRVKHELTEVYHEYGLKC